MKPTMKLLLTIVSIAFLAMNVTALYQGADVSTYADAVEGSTSSGENIHGRRACACDYNEALLVDITRAFLYVQLTQNETQRATFESALIDDSKFYGLGNVAAEGVAGLSEAIRVVNPTGLEDNTDIRKLRISVGCRIDTCLPSVSAHLTRGFRNAFTNETLNIFYLYIVEFNANYKILNIYDQPFSDQILQIWPFAKPNLPGGFAYGLCETLAFACPSIQYPAKSNGDPQTCYQYVNSLRATNLKNLGITDNPTQTCVAMLVANMANNPPSAPFLCPMVAPNNGSPVGCFRTDGKRSSDI